MDAQILPSSIVEPTAPGYPGNTVTPSVPETDPTRYRLGSGPCSVCGDAPNGCRGFQGGGMACNKCKHDFSLHR